MSKQQIKKIIENRLSHDGMVETGIKGVQLFRVTEAHQCAPAVYEPTVVAIVSGAKEAILGGKKYAYDSREYLCCPVSLPVEAGTPSATQEDPLLGVYISLDTQVMTELALEIESTTSSSVKPLNSPTLGLTLAPWDDAFMSSLLRLLQLSENPTDSAVLGNGRLRELYYAVLKGKAGETARRAFGVGSEIAKAIQYLSAHLNETITIEEVAAQAGMSRAVFHRKFKQTTTMSPIQFVKSMRLNSAAMKIAVGKNVSEAAMEVGYSSASQFSREFKRLYGQSPKQWSHFNQLPSHRK